MTNKQTTVTLAAHACRGLISVAYIEEELLGLESFVSPDILQWLLAPVEVRESQDPLVQTENAATVVDTAIGRASLKPESSSSPSPSQPHLLLPKREPHLLPVPERQPHPSSSSSRFGDPVTRENLCSVIDKGVPANTKRTTNWGYRVWTDWCKAKNTQENIGDMEKSMMNDALARFVQEARRKDGKEYPASSLHNIVAAIQRYLRENGRPEVSFFDEIRRHLTFFGKASMQE